MKEFIFGFILGILICKYEFIIEEISYIYKTYKRMKKNSDE